MADIRLYNNDLIFENDDLVLVNNSDAIIQHLSIRLKFYLGEWFLDQRLGVPYFDKVFIKNPSLILIRTMFRDVILTTPGIISISKFDLNLISNNRILDTSFTVESSSGKILDFSEEFIIS